MPERMFLKMRVLKSLVVLAALALLALPAHADSVGMLTLSNCGTSGTGCPAAIYNFDITNTSATLSITVTGPVNSSNDTITGVDLGFVPQNDISSLSSTVTTVFNGSAGPGWAAVLGSLNNANCSGNSGAFVCSMPTATGTPVTLVQGDTYSWTWTYTLTGQGGTDLASDTSVHVGANYGPANGLIVSQVANVPEPGTLGLAFAGLIGLAGLRLRRANS